MITKEQIKNKIHEAIEESELTQREIGERIGVHQGIRKDTECRR